MNCYLFVGDDGSGGGDGGDALTVLRGIVRILKRILGCSQPRPQGFSFKKWVGREKALASAGHVSPRTP